MRTARLCFWVVGKLFLLGICLAGPSASSSAQPAVPGQGPQSFTVALLKRSGPAAFAPVPGRTELTAKVLIQQKDGRVVPIAPVKVSFLNGLAQIPVVESKSALFLEGAPTGTVIAVQPNAVPAPDFSAALASQESKAIYRTSKGEVFALYTTEYSKQPQALLALGKAFSSQSPANSAALGAAMVVDLPGVYAKLVGQFGFAAGGPEKFAENAFTVLMNMRNGFGSGSGSSLVNGPGSGGFGGSAGGTNRPGAGALNCPSGGNAGGGVTGGDGDALPVATEMCPRGVIRVTLPGACDLCRVLGPQQCTICEGPKSCSTYANCIVTSFELCTIKLGGGACLTS
jgi:hypothetical protein